MRRRPSTIIHTHISSSLLNLLFPSLSPRVWTYGEPLAVIRLAAAEQCLERVVRRDREAGCVDQELAGDVEEDKEEVERGEAEDDVDFRDAGLVEGSVLLVVKRGMSIGECLLELQIGLGRGR